MDVSLYYGLKVVHFLSISVWIGSQICLAYIMSKHVVEKQNSLLETIEHRVLRFILNPAMIFAFISGVYLIYLTKAGFPGQGGWMHAKGTVLVALFISHAFLARHRKKFVQANFSQTPGFFKAISALTFIFAVIIIYLVVFKPF